MALRIGLVGLGMDLYPSRGCKAPSFISAYFWVENHNLQIVMTLTAFTTSQLLYPLVFLSVGKVTSLETRPLPQRLMPRLRARTLQLSYHDTRYLRLRNNFFRTLSPLPFPYPSPTSTNHSCKTDRSHLQAEKLYRPQTTHS